MNLYNDNQVELKTIGAETKTFSHDIFGDTRTISIGDEIYFVAKDIAENLGYSSSSINQITNLMGAVPEKWKGINPVNTLGGCQKLLCLTKQGLWFFLARSDKPIAVEYQMWLAEVVMPSIEETGSYSLNLVNTIKEALINKPLDVITALLEIREEQRQQIKFLENRIEKDASKVLLANVMLGSDRQILVRELCKYFKQNGFDTGEVRFFEELRNKGFLIKKGRDYNTPTQKSMELGLFILKRTQFQHKDGTFDSKPTSLLTPKGWEYFIYKYLGKRVKFEESYKEICKTS